MTAEPVPADEVTIVLDGASTTIVPTVGDTLLETARRAGLTPPFACEAGNCGTCIAKLTQGSAIMRVNDALDEDEVEEGYVLTCQAIPEPGPLTVNYDD
ncbi:MAG: 2Fe-2S iron-sulfur cluster-binding protein [Mycolicibacterium neoaurum]|uniref:2Fe-2S iron-sulfur cluster-binding protein n=1 Tax=Mycolicibacterium neoaurum TaxID=1795 RepID=UPI000567B05C|nr:2Fe-2S iron-sulfur cluster-binding protein [Mycolicibacterium neoaurum]SDD67076.1 Ferredoxin [Mycolicibacterium neoaurum]